MLQHLRQTQRKKEEGCWIDHDNAQTVILLGNKEFQAVPGKSCVVIAMMLQSNWKYPVMETMMER